MNSRAGYEMPSDVVKQLFDSDRETGGKPVLPPEHGPRAKAWFRRIMVDFESLEQHLSLLQELYDAPFHYPRPRRDCWSAEQLLPSEEPTKFRHAKRLPDDRIAAVADEGAEALSSEELARLLLNPFALFDLFDIIDDLHPDKWMGVMEEVGREGQGREADSPLREPAPFGPSSGGHRPKQVAQRQRWAKVGAALAACLFLGLGIGLWAGGGMGLHPEARQIQVSAARMGDEVRDPEKPKDIVLRINAEQRGFATIVFLFPDQRQYVVPGVAGNLIPVDAGQPTVTPASPPICREATAALIVITRQPANAPIWKALEESTFNSAQIDNLQSFLHHHLETLGFGPIGFAKVPLAAPAQ